MRVIENGVDVARFRSATALPRAELGLGQDEVVVAMAGAFRPEKNQAALIEAVPQRHVAFLRQMGRK